MGDAMERALVDPSLADRMGEASLSIARPHAQERTFEAYENLYRRLARRSLARLP